MVTTGIVISDTHLDATEEPHWSYLLAKRFIADINPDYVVHLGDVLELSYLSSFNSGKARLLEGKRLKADLDLFETEMRWLRKHTDKVVVLEGNHDERIQRILDVDPVVEGLVEIHNLNVVKDGTIEWYPLLDQPIYLDGLFACHGWWVPQNPAKKHLEEIGGSTIFGHVHRRSYWSKIRWSDNVETTATGLGCLTNHQPPWLKGKPSGWQYDLAEIVTDNEGATRVNRLPIIDGKLIYEGRVWRRTDL